jgi:hypothetical protein
MLLENTGKILPDYTSNGTHTVNSAFETLRIGGKRRVNKKSMNKKSMNKKSANKKSANKKKNTKKLRR